MVSSGDQAQLKVINDQNGFTRAKSGKPGSKSHLVSITIARGADGPVRGFYESDFGKQSGYREAEIC